MGVWGRIFTLSLFMPVSGLYFLNRPQRWAGFFCVFSVSVRDRNFRGWYFVRRQEYGIMETTHEYPVKIESTGSVGPWPGAL